MLIRRAVAKDIDAIHELDVESTEYHKRFDKDFYTVSEKWWRVKKDSQRKALKDSTNLILVAEDSKEVVAYIWGFVDKITRFNVGKIQEIAVSSEYRNRGIAMQLVRKMLNFFKKKKCIISEVEVNIRNNPAIELYEKVGFMKQNCKMILKLKKGKSFSPLS